MRASAQEPSSAVLSRHGEQEPLQRNVATNTALMREQDLAHDAAADDFAHCIRPRRRIGGDDCAGACTKLTTLVDVVQLRRRLPLGRFRPADGNAYMQALPTAADPFMSVPLHVIWPGHAPVHVCAVQPFTASPAQVTPQ
jgi:hypothetical protein